MIYIVMTNDYPHAAFTLEKEAEAYAKLGNDHEKEHNNHRVIYHVEEAPLDDNPPLFGVSPI